MSVAEIDTTSSGLGSDDTAHFFLRNVEKETRKKNIKAKLKGKTQHSVHAKNCQFRWVNNEENSTHQISARKSRLLLMTQFRLREMCQLDAEFVGFGIGPGAV